jgi:ATP-dependent helicase/nuclease subunit B
MARYQNLFESATKEALGGATVLTGNRRASRQVLAACEHRLRLDYNAWETPCVLPWDAWLHRTWQECLLSGATNLTLLSPVQARAIWRQIIVASGGTVGNKSGVVEIAWQAWQQLHEYGIELSSSAFHVTPETRSFYDWAQRYRDLCNKNGWTDSSRLPDELRGLCRDGSLIRPRRVEDPVLPSQAKIVLYGFDDFTPQQLRLHEALRTSGIDVVALIPDESWTVPETARCVDAADSKDELTAAAHWVRATLAANPDARIGIVVPALNKLRSDTDHIFTRVLHPEALLTRNADSPRAFDISLGQPLSEYPIIAAALTAIRLAVDAVPTHDATVLLRSPYVGSSEAEASPRARFDVYLRGVSGPEIKLAPLTEVLASEDNPANCPALKWHLKQFASIAEKLHDPLRPSEWADRIGELLESLGWPGDDERGRPLNSAEYQTVQAWSELLAELARLDLIAASLQPFEMADEIGRLAQERIFKPESAGAPVQILGPFEAAGSVFDHLWITGLSDDVWPARGNTNPFLPLALQRDAGVPHSVPAQDFAFAGRITTRMAESAAEVVFSWPKRQEDSLLRPSPLLEGIPKSNVLHFVAETPVWGRGCAPSQTCAGDAVPDWPTLQRVVSTETYNGESAPPLDYSAVRGGTRIFELQSNCPFHAFAELRLGATKLDEPQLGLRARDRGRVIETALQLVWTHLRNHFTLMQTPQPELDHIVGESVDQAISRIPPPREAWEQRYRQLERGRLIALVNEWLEVERRREAFEVVEHQREVTVSAGGITVSGRIDRLDRTNDGGLVVIDYKSGNGNYGPGQWNGERPERPQLPLYVIAQTQPVSGVAFGLLRTGRCDMKGLAARKEILGQSRDNSKRYLNDNDFEQHVAGWRPVLDEIGKSFRNGIASPDPLPERVCEFCHLPAVCRRAEQETDDPCQHGEVDDEE